MLACSFFYADRTSWFCSVVGHVHRISSNEGSHIKCCRNNKKSIFNHCSLPSAPTGINPETHVCDVCMRVCYLHGGGCGAGGRRRAVCKGNIGDGKELLFAEDGDKGNPQH